MSAWESEKQRQTVEFTITERDLDADMRLSSPEVSIVTTHTQVGFTALPFVRTPMVYSVFSWLLAILVNKLNQRFSLEQ
jgi:hypothetical protein